MDSILRTMKKSPLDVIRSYQNSPKPPGNEWTVLPGLSEDEIAAHIVNWSTCGYPFPDLLQELLRVTAGLKRGEQQISFECPSNPYGDDLYLCPLLDDDTGNFWAMDTVVDPSRLGPIFFVCHDPPVIFYQAYDLATFLDSLLNGKAMVATDHAIWRAGAAGGVVQGDWIVFDLQAEVVGAGAPLSLYYEHPNGLERVGKSLVFRILRRERSWWQRIRDKWR